MKEIMAFEETGMSISDSNLLNPTDFDWVKIGDKGRLCPLINDVAPIFKPRFKVGDRIYFLTNNQAYEQPVTEVTIFVRKDSSGLYPHGWYNMSVKYHSYSMNVPDNVYGSKQELLDSL
jgi:hypothetical protein